MWGACVGVYQLLNWKMHGETLKKGQTVYIKCGKILSHIREH